jgi:hypothetical protein
VVLESQLLVSRCAERRRDQALRPLQVKKIKQWVFYKRDEDRIAQAKEAVASDW